MFGSLRLLALFAAGGLGTLARFGTSVFLARFFEKGTPWGTATINGLGCFAFGFLAALFAARSNWSVETKTVVLTGFLGAFTTFSTYMFEIHSLLKSGDYFRAFAGFFVQNGLGFAAVAFGFLLARRCFCVC